MSESLRSLTKNERIAHLLTFLAKNERFAPKFDERIPNPAPGGGECRVAALRREKGPGGGVEARVCRTN